ncbi:MAG TPA: retroviral-like aspartic protease family protein [Cryomorphaceae bacterium]|nr:retroviral-like aspartic protease family protein [Cryomorphaceae bacterium]
MELLAQEAPGSEQVVLSHHSADLALYSRIDPMPNCEDEEIVIPLKRAGKLLMIECEVDGKKGNFIFDTGAPYLVLNATYFRDYDLRNELYASGITGGQVALMTTRVDKLQVKNLWYNNVEADVAELGHIENARGVKILGLLGLNLFKSFVIEVDLSKATLKLTRCSKKGETKDLDPTKYDLVHKLGFLNNTIYVNCEVAGKRLTYGLDTGAEINVISSFSNKKVLETIKITGRSSLMGTGSERVEILYGSMKELYMGELMFENMQTVITQLEDMGGAYGFAIDGMLGYELFSRGKVVINIPKKEMMIRLFDNFRKQ